MAERLDPKCGEEDIQSLFESLFQRADLAQCPVALEGSVEVIASGDSSARGKLMNLRNHVEKNY